jgi:hypothetical protein
MRVLPMNHAIEEGETPAVVRAFNKLRHNDMTEDYPEAHRPATKNHENGCDAVPPVKRMFLIHGKTVKLHWHHPQKKYQ